MIFTSVLIGCWDYSNLCFDFTQLKHSLCVTERKGRGGVGEDRFGMTQHGCLPITAVGCIR